MQSKLIKQNGAVKIEIDGKVYEPLSFKSFRPSARNISDFYQAGVRIFDILTSGIISLLGVPYSLYGESWIGDHEYDFEKIDAQIDLFIANAPEAYFALMVQLDTRPWYCEKYQVPYTFTHLSQEIADEEWRKAAKDYLRAVIRHTEEKYGDRFYGYFLLGGMTTEWFSHCDNEETYPTKLNAYRRCLHDESAVIPSQSERELPTDILLLDPSKQKNLVTYRKFHSQLISHAICEFAHVVKEETDYRKLCGVYYGYLFELQGSRLWDSGSLDYETVYTCPDIDMISSPSSYSFRGYHDASAVMLTSDTLDARSKLYFLEFDHITHLAPQFVPDGNGIGIPGYTSKFKSERETIDVMRRDFMLCCSRRMALWWFDMFEGWFYSDGMMNEVRNFVEIAKRFSTFDTRSVAEVCVFAEGAESLCYVNKLSEYNTDTLSCQRDGLARMGAPYDIYSICDLKSIDYDRYKLFIFLDEFKLSEENLKIIREKIQVAGKTQLWFGAPNAVSESGISAEAVSSLVGMKVSFKRRMLHRGSAFGKPMGNGRVCDGFAVTDAAALTLGTNEESEVILALAEANGNRSIFASYGDIPGEALAEILKLAGVHIYTTACPTYVNASMIGVYLNPGEDARVRLKNDGKFVDIFSGRKFESANSELTIPFADYRSVMLIPQCTSET